MKCPIDGTDLTMSERQGIEIDYCPKCRGVWLDRGELDKLIERSEPQASPAPAHADPYRDNRRPPDYDDRRSYDDRRGYDRDDDRKYHGGKRRKSLLGELFDF